MNKYDAYKKDLQFQVDLKGYNFSFRTTWGLFCPEHIDDGSRLLLDYVNVNPHDTVLDVGCGYGAIGLPLAKQAEHGIVHLIDKDFVAVEYAKRNAVENNIHNVEVYLSNGLSYVPPISFDVVVSNLPAKVSNELFYILFHDIKSRLRPQGRLYVVTINGLREYIKRTFRDIFGTYDKLKQGASYTVSATMKQPDGN
jgi:16S rRNA G1207 methylase RsmC